MSNKTDQNERCNNPKCSCADCNCGASCRCARCGK